MLIQLREKGKYCCILRTYLNCPILGSQYSTANYYFYLSLALFWPKGTTFTLKFKCSKLWVLSTASVSMCAPGGNTWPVTSALPSLDIIRTVDAAACFFLRWMSDGWLFFLILGLIALSEAALSIRSLNHLIWAKILKLRMLCDFLLRLLRSQKIGARNFED